MRRLSIAIVLVLAACGGDDDGSGSVGSVCAAHAGCDQGLYCDGPNDWPGCGIPPRQGCTDDAACLGNRCHAIADPCSVDGFGSECGAPCSPGLCGAGFRCDAGACVAIRCDEGAGVTCAAREVCDPARITASTPTWDRTDACYPVTCTDDSVCGARFCVNGECQDARGTCEEQVLLP